ncbi:uncharacterized protein N7473_009122, partial [Penicillium subrubescens]|uniref:uncharacterized protein n=1 Tax=Penicillium subrubescens TaxID=1316194 RepID=UPI0025451FF2
KLIMFCISVFRNQCFSSLPLQDLVKYGSFFGRNPVHTVMRNPPSHPEIAVVFHGAEETNAASSQWHTNSTIWHSDVSYENQPPGTTFLYHLQGPPCGGDTLFVNQGAAFRRLSPAFQQFLRPLRAVHSGLEQAQDSQARGFSCRRDPIQTALLIVRTRPVTGEEALYVNPLFTRYILGLKTEESQVILGFLFNHITSSPNIQCRVTWEQGTTIVYDDRVTAHTGIFDFADGQLRHLARLTPQAEVPFHLLSSSINE